MLSVPRRLLLNDEGSSALHFIDLDAPTRSWSSPGAGRDLQLIGAGRVLRSAPNGFVELDLKTGKVLRTAAIASASEAGIESARRLPIGTTTVLGNSEAGIFIAELSTDEQPRELRRVVAPGMQKGRLLRHTADGAMLFCSETDGVRRVHRATFERGVESLFEIPSNVAADSMVKAVQLDRDRVAVSSGYAATLLIIDTTRGVVERMIGGKEQAGLPGQRRELRPFFFSGYQVLPNGRWLIANWQGHGPSHAAEGYQLLMYSASGELLWSFDQTEFPRVASLNNVLALDTGPVTGGAVLCDERWGILAPVAANAAQA
jgi:hypothetical protein